MRVIGAILMSVLALPALGGAPETSPRPVARVAATAQEGAGVALALSTMGMARAPRPVLRPDHIVHKAMARQRERARGAVCGSRDIQGEPVGDVPGRIPGCGVRDAVKLRSVSGVVLSQQAIMDCDTAKALNLWVDRDLKRAVGRMGGGISSLKVAAHYVCRTRNHKPGAPISEHGKGKAIDISEVRLQNGDTLNVARDWGKGRKGRVLRKAHKAACGTFGTTLGPGSDGYHEDHFHYDTARHYGGPYCR